MRTTTLFAIGLTTVICLSTLLWQRSSIGALKKETATLAGRIATDPISPDQPSEPPTEAPTPKDRKPPTIESLLALAEDETSGAGAMNFYGRAGHILREVEDCNIAQLLNLVRQLRADSLPSESATSSAPYLQMLLLLVIAEEDPIAALDLLEEGETIPATAGEEMRPSILAMVAKTDPKLALSKVHREGISDRERDSTHIAIARALLATDVKTAFELVEGIKTRRPGQGLAGMIATSRDPQVTSQLWQEANQMQAGKLRSDILAGLLGAAMLQGGGASVENEFRRINNLEEDERNTLVKDLAHDYMQIDPGWTLEFATEHASGKTRATILNKAIVEWAQMDFNAAGTWLGTQPSSPERDGMIGRFVRQIVALDRDAATAWAGEISDEGLRAAALKQITQPADGTKELVKPSPFD